MLIVFMLNVALTTVIYAECHIILLSCIQHKNAQHYNENSMTYSINDTQHDKTQYLVLLFKVSCFY
jgi:hypothetical protein